MVMEYMEHDLKGLIQSRNQPFSQSEVKCLMLQLLEGVKYLHDHWVLHRDLKTSNLLLNNKGELKICDFGMSRQYGSPLKPYTPWVVTLWYRAPELLLGAKEYSTAVDMWSVGCIMAELLSNKPLFDGKTEFDQLDKIFKTLGTPTERIWPGYLQLPGVKINIVQHPYNVLHKKFPRTSFTGSPVLSDLGLDLLSQLLTYDPDKRITAEDALNHGWFHEVPLPKCKDFMPTFPALHSQKSAKEPGCFGGAQRKDCNAVVIYLQGCSDGQCIANWDDFLSLSCLTEKISRLQLIIATAPSPQVCEVPTSCVAVGLPVHGRSELSCSFSSGTAVSVEAFFLCFPVFVGKFAEFAGCHLAFLQLRNWKELLGKKIQDNNVDHKVFDDFHFF
ncbi:hypothetical protein Nepgr_003011 [Nepenthes gracilis]|uniref:Protein kinase domain-containing protein n=1 Tax=Nepenthes gracilis TaxID=150966 RepID=A0AAD3RYR1_NEPGR|nr:hypothetical protein Nepgr_003011 [Nepenthes gracilis]